MTPTPGPRPDAPAAPGRTSTPWDKRLEQIVRWVGENGRQPSKNSRDPVEKSLGVWLVHQRRAAKGAMPVARTFTPERRARLDAELPGWQTADWARAEQGWDAAWRSSFDGAVAWRRAHRRMPNLGKDADAEELRWAKWLHTQRQAAKGHGSPTGLSAERRRLLDAHLPGWDRSYETRWAQLLAETETWVRAHRRLPSAEAHGPTERRLGKWLARQRRYALHGARRAFTPRQRAELDARVPGWDRPRGPGRSAQHDVTWASHLRRVVTWSREHEGRLPSQGGNDPVEHRLAHWLVTQRMIARGRATRPKSLAPERRRRLDAELPGWDQTRDAAWAEALAEVSVWVRSRGHLPATAAANDEERRLAEWLSNQRRGARRYWRKGAGPFTPERWERLEAYVPGWDRPAGPGHSRERITAWESDLDLTVEWVRRHDRLPLPRATDPQERRVGIWLAGQQRAAVPRGGRPPGLTASKRRRLDTQLPGWDGAPVPLAHRGVLPPTLDDDPPWDVEG